MKKIILFLMTFTIAYSAHAQYRDVKLPEKPELPDYKDYSTQNNGFWYAIEAEAGSSIMATGPNMQYVQVGFTGGYRFNDFFRIGAGLAGRMYVHNADIRDVNNDYGVPIYFNARGKFLSAYDRDGVPYWSINIGGITNEGFFASPTLGYSFGGLRNNFLIGVSYTITSFTDYTKKSNAYSFFALRLGYEF